MSRSEPLSMMVFALAILVFPGLILNNMVNTGMVQTTQSMSCDNITFTCTIQGNVGCQTTGTNPLGNCNLQGSAISFLNTCSPFTGILTGDFIAFVSSFFTNCGTSSSQTTPQIIRIGGAGNTTIQSCTLLYPVAADNEGLSCASSSPTLQNIVYPLEVTVGATACFGAGTITPWNGIIGNSTVGSTPTQTTVCFIDSNPSSNNVFFQGNCLTYGVFYGTVGDPRNHITYLVCNQLLTVVASGTATGISVSSLLTFGLTFLGLGLLLFLGLGLSFGIGGSVLASGGSASLGTNPQGSKLAQVFGIALLIYAPLSSEFSTWYSSGYLPYGLDGTIGIVGVAITAIFFFGAYKLSQSGGLNN